MKTGSSRSGLDLAAAFAAVWLIWGSTYLAIAVAIDTLPPFSMAGSRFFAAGFLVVVVLRARGVPWPRPREWAGAVLVGGLMLFGGNGLVTWAEQRVPSSVAALLITTVPLWMTLLDGMVYGGLRPRVRSWVGLVLGFAGVVVLVRPSGDDLGRIDPAGAAALLLAAFSWANGSLLSRRVRLPLSPAMAVGAEMVAAGLLLLGLGLARGELSAWRPGDASRESVAALLYLVFFGSIIAFSAYMYLLRRVSAVAVSTYAFVNPIVAVILGWRLGGEAITTRVLFAGALILMAVSTILARGRRAHTGFRGADPGAINPDPDAAGSLARRPPAGPTTDGPPCPRTR